MKKYMDKLKNKIGINRNLFVFLMVIVIVGIVFGAMFSTILDLNDKQLVGSYLNDFFTNVKSGELNYKSSLINSLIFTAGFALLIWLLGISVIGFFIIIFLLFLKSFILGFTVGSLIINFKLKGVLYSFIYVFPHQVINVLIFMLLCGYSLIISFKLISCFMGKKVLDFKNIFNRYLIVLLISVLVLVLTSLYEVYVMPYLLNILLCLLK